MVKRFAKWLAGKVNCRLQPLYVCSQCYHEKGRDKIAGVSGSPGRKVRERESKLAEAALAQQLIFFDEEWHRDLMGDDVLPSQIAAFAVLDLLSRAHFSRRDDGVVEISFYPYEILAPCIPISGRRTREINTCGHGECWSETITYPAWMVKKGVDGEKYVPIPEFID